MLALLLSVSLPHLPAAEPADDHKALAAVVRSLLIKNLPDPAVSSKHNWGQQKEVVTRFESERTGPLRWKVEPVKEKKNDGHWTAIQLNPDDPARKLTLDIANIINPKPGTTRFTATLAGPVKFQFQQQLWKAGLRLYSGETRGSCQSRVALKCETVNQLDWKPGQLLPTQLLRVRITEADLTYQDLKIEHTAGVGGEAAEVIGDVVVRTVKLLKPNLEKDLIEKANAAIVKAGKSREVKVELEKLIK